MTKQEAAMTDLFRRALAIAIAVFVCAQAAPSLAEAGLLDGKVFIADTGEKGKPADEKKDAITFQDGLFHSSACDQWG
jgi:hypothetical protein